MMRSPLRATVLCLSLTSPALAHAEMQSDDWLLSHPYDQPERMQHGDWEVLQDLEWERAVFEADQYRHRKQAEEWARRAASLPPADYSRPMQKGN
jgi:hypothetical protein